MVEFWEIWYGMVEHGMRRGMVLFSNRPRTALPYGDVWSYWPQLESIEVMERCESLGVDFDGQFLGINPEEVELLGELDDESLEKLNIVPIRPSVLTMQRKLRQVNSLFRWILGFKLHFLVIL